MAKTKHNSSHKDRVNKFKNNIKQNKQNMDQQVQNQIPPVRSVPVWENDAIITITGIEWEAIYNGVMNLQLAQQGCNAVMSRNIVSGAIGMDFEKLSEDKQSYVPMTEEEKAPHRESFAKMLEAARRQQAGAPVAAAAPTETAKVAKPKKAPKAKVVKGDFSAKTKEELTPGQLTAPTDLVEPNTSETPQA